MKRLLLVSLALVAALILSACGTTQSPTPNPGADKKPENTNTFIRILTQIRYDELGEDADFSNEESVETADIGEELIFLAEHRRGPQYVHVRVFGPDGKAVEELEPIERWEGLEAKQYVLRHTPTKAGRYHFQMIVSGSYGAPFDDSPYDAYVEVIKKEDGGGETPPPSGECTSSKDATLETPASVNRNQSFEMKFYIPCDVLYASLQVYNKAGNEVDRWTISSSSDLERWAGETIRRTFSYGQNDRLYVELTVNRKSHPNRVLTKYVQVGSESSGGGTPPPPPSEECTSSKRATLSTPSSVARNESFDATFYIPCGSEYVSLQVYNERGDEVNRWTLNRNELDRYEGTTVSHRLSYDRNNRLYIELTVNGRYSDQLSRYVRVGSGSGGTTPPPPAASACDLMNWFDVTDQNDRRISNGARVRIGSRDTLSLNWSVSSSADAVRVTLHRDGREVFNSRSRDGSRYLSNADLREGSYRARLVIDEGRDTCDRTIDFTVVRDDGGSTPPPSAGSCPSGIDVAVRYGDFDYRDVIYVPRSGENFRLVWSSTSRDFAEGTYVQLVGPRGVDAFQSTERSGNRTVSPSTLEVGQYDFRFTGYHRDGRTACLRVVTIHVTN